MITFQVIDNIQELNSILDSYKDNGWQLDESVEGIQVNEQCRRISDYYCGRSYNVVRLAEKTYSTIEKVIRAVLGTLATLVTLGLALCLKSVRSLFSENKKVVC